MHTKEDKQKALILRCRYFNGEKNAPKWMDQNQKMFWFYESCWVNFTLEDKIPLDYLQEYPCLKDFMKDDGTPQDLKALICDRYCHFGGTEEGFMDLYMKEYRLRLTNKQRIDYGWKLRRCRLYKGEGINEYERLLQHGVSFREPNESYKEDKTEDEIKEVLVSFYAMEYTWVVLEKYNKLSKNPYIESKFKSVYGEKYPELQDGTPCDLQDLLLHGFLDWVDGVYHRATTGYELELFIRYYIEYYKPILTPIQEREKERRPQLLAKCSYYKGEQTNPWEYCYSPVLVWRKEIWNIEKEWVDGMTDSYHCPQSSKQLISDLVLGEYFKSKGVALSLLNLILTKEKVKTEESKTDFGAIEAIKTYEKYKKLAPLGHDYKKYFAFYLGEEKLPFGYDDNEEYKRMGWSQEQLQANSKPNLMCDFDSDEFQKEHRGEEGIWGWYADPMFPKEQKEILFFNICNWGIWCPYCNEDKLAEEYLNYHYPGNKQ